MTDPWPHQKQAIAFASARTSAMLAMEMGTGKTLCALRTLDRWGAQRILVLAPLSVLPVWRSEIAKHCDAHWRVAILEGTLRERTVQVRREIIRQHKTEADRQEQTLSESPWDSGDAGQYHAARVVCVTNYEAILGDDLFDAMKWSGFDALVLDESHKVKAPGGKISRRCSQIADRIPHRLALTGTPMPHSPLDIYAQYRALDKTIFGTSNTLFRARYAVMGGYEQKEVVGFAHLDELHEKMMTASFRVRADEVLDLPGMTDVVLRCALEPEAMAAYRRLERTYVLEMAEGTITANNALAKLLRLQQITSGYLPLEDDQGERHSTRVSTAKQRLLSETVEGMLPVELFGEQEPIVVFARFHADLDAAREVALEHKLTPAELSGRRNDLAMWQAGDADLLAVQVQAGGLGVDMSRARFAIYYSLGYGLGDLLQSQARLHRPGQTRPVTYAYLVAENTVDEDVLEALRKREQVVSYVVDKLRSKTGGAP